ncbi:MAG: FadR family transcriptional regulator [Desulfobacteraceae bacterium]|nr:FadR family transcriptional regulator [Desulfobacteraceae bacterium]MBC2749359.1 FadR family transcriptional regulator [Desulfobacteraceae bacterium]
MNAPINLSLFRPAKIGRASEDVALQIEAAIIDGQLNKGERLPSERNLQTLFRTSRGVIREALRALKEKGLLEIKKGARGGAYVKNVELINASEPLALFLKQQKIPVEFLIEFRESIDRTITLLAITRGTAEAKQALLEKTAYFQKLVSEPDLNLEKIAEIDREMNIALVKMAGNPMFEMSMRTIQIGFSSQDQALYEDAKYRSETALNWHETAQQIAAGETLRALSCISYHYVLLQRCLAKRRPQGIDAPVGTAIGIPTPASDASAPSPPFFETIKTSTGDD